MSRWRLPIFPFEAPLYEQAGVPVQFLGHPLVDRVPAPSADPAEAARHQATLRAALGLDAARPVVALLPGSRHNELSRLVPVVAAALPLISRRGARRAVRGGVCARTTARRVRARSSRRRRARRWWSSGPTTCWRRRMSSSRPRARPPRRRRCTSGRWWSSTSCRRSPTRSASRWSPWTPTRWPISSPAIASCRNSSRRAARPRRSPPRRRRSCATAAAGSRRTRVWPRRARSSAPRIDRAGGRGRAGGGARRAIGVRPVGSRRTDATPK